MTTRDSWLHARIPYLLAKRFDDYCHELNLSKSEAVRDAIEHLVKSKGKMGDIEKIKRELERHVQDSAARERELRASLTAAMHEAAKQREELEVSARESAKAERLANACQGCGVLDYAVCDKVSDVRVCNDCYRQGRHFELVAQKMKEDKIHD